MKNKYEIRGDVTTIFINYKGSILESLNDAKNAIVEARSKTMKYASN